MNLLLIALILLLLSGVLALPGRRGGGLIPRLATLVGLGGAALGFLATAYCIFHPEAAVISIPWPTIDGLFLLRLDPLAAVFLFPLFLLTGAGQLYGVGYRHPRATWIDFFYQLLAVGMVLVLIVRPTGIMGVRISE